MDLQQIAVPGLHARVIQPEDVLSKNIGATAAPIQSGDVVQFTTDGTKVLSVTGPTPARFGLCIFTQIGKNGKDSAGNEAFVQYDNAPIAVDGAWWVKPNAPVTDITAKVYVRTGNATTNAPLGSLQSAAADGTEWAGAMWETVTTADGFAIVNLK